MELVSEADDIWVIGYTDTLGYTSLRGWDGTYGVTRQTSSTTYSTYSGVSPAGHSDGCSWGGTQYTNGCAWLTGSNLVPKIGSMVHLIQARNLGGTSGVGFASFESVAAGIRPSGDAGRWCTHWSCPFGPCICDTYAERLLVAYTNPTRTALKAKRLSTAGAVIGNEISVTTGSGIDHVRVAWLQTGDTGHWLVSYDARELCPTSQLQASRIHTVVVNWDGSKGSDNSVGWCGYDTTCNHPSSPAIYSEPATPLLNSEMYCYSTSLAARAPFAVGPDDFAFNEYVFTRYVLDSNGVAIQHLGGSAAEFVSGTYTSDYAFRNVQGDGGCMVSLCSDPWLCTDIGDYSSFVDPAPPNHCISYAEDLRNGFHTAAVLSYLHDGTNDLYLTLLAN
ncbi:MAG TPA: hypothetical protein VGQ83_18020 [Polyangia bacterium]